MSEAGDGGAEPAGGGAPREVRYAEPWDEEAYLIENSREAKKVHVLIAIIVLITILISILQDIDFAIHYFTHSSPLDLLPFFGLLVTLLLFPDIARQLVLDLIPLEEYPAGWSKRFNMLFEKKMSRALSVGLISITISSFSDLLETPSIIDILTTMILISIIALINKCPYIFTILSSSRKAGLYSREFILNYDDVIFLLVDKNLEIWGKSEMERKSIFAIIKMNGDEIQISKSNSEKSIVTIQTPCNQPERNRELREAVSAILEGRPWPPEAGDGDAPGGGRAKEGA